MEKINVAIIGAGWFGKYHLENCKKEKDIDVKAVVCTNQSKLEPIQKKYPEIHYYDSADIMLKRQENLDALIVAVPPDSHHGIERKAVERNLALFMEKPLGTDRKTVLENLYLIEKSGITTSVGYHTRYNPAIERVRNYLLQNKACTLAIKWVDSMPSTPWWKIKKRSGGQIIEQATHYLDTIRYLVGDISEVSGFSRSDLHYNVANFSNDSASVAILRFNNNVLGTLEVGCYKNDVAEKEITLVINTTNKICRYTWNGEASIGTSILEGIPIDEIYRRELRIFFDAVRSKDCSQIRCSYREGVKTFLTTLAIEESLNKNVSLEVETL